MKVDIKIVTYELAVRITISNAMSYCNPSTVIAKLFDKTQPC